MEWSTVGKWLKDNAQPGAALVGSLITGNVPAAVAAGVALVSSATGHNDPQAAFEALQEDPSTRVKLQELAQQEQASIRTHLESMTRLALEDEQAAHQTTQETIRAGDAAEDPFVRRTRPAQSWLSLFAGIVYVFVMAHPDEFVVGVLFALPFTYAGLREVGKGLQVFAARKVRGTA